MRPLSLNCAKALLPFCGRPLLDYTLDQLRRSQCAEVVVVAGLSDVGYEQYESLKLSGGMKIRIVRCGLEHGSAGVLKYLVTSAAVLTEQMLVIYGDSLLQVDFDELLRAHEDRSVKGCDITVTWQTPDDLVLPGEPRTNYGILWLGDDDRCLRFAEKPQVGELSSQCASAGIFVLNRSVLMQLPTGRPLDLSADLIAELSNGTASPVFGFHLVGGYRFDIGTISDYVSKQFAALDGTIQVRGISPRERLHLGQDVTIGKDTRLTGHNILGNLVSIGDRCEIANCVVLDRTVIEDDVRMSGVVLGRECRIQHGTVLRSGTVLGDYCQVCSGS